MRAAVLGCALLLAAPAAAVTPAERLPDPVLEARARDISRELRCVVCQNQSIDDSDAQLAADLRILVRERLVAGDSDEQVVAFLTARYGDYVRLRPSFAGANLVLWLAPAAVLGAGLIAAARYVRRRAPAGQEAPLAEDEERELSAILARRDGSP